VTAPPLAARRVPGPTFLLPSVLGSDLMVPLADGTIVPFANFDHAATTPCLETVARAVNEFLPWYASAHRGAGTLSNMCTARYEEARQTVRQFLGCRQDDSVIFVRNTTDAFNLLARAVPADATVITFAGEHHANLLPWRAANLLPMRSRVDDLLADLEQALRGRATGEVLVTVSAAINVTGELLPLAEIVALTREHDARIAVDAAQLVAHRPLDVAALDLDYVAFSGHKMYAPFGVGVLAGRSDWLDAAEPYLAGGGATLHVSDNRTDVVWATGEARHEAGTPNVVGAVAVAAACNALQPAWDSLVPYEAALQERLRSGLAEVPEFRELSLFEPASPRIGIVTFTLDEVDSGLLATALSIEYGVGVREGRFCAHPLTRHLLHHADQASEDDGLSAVRVSLGLGIALQHVDRLVDAIHTISEIGPQLLYDRHPDGTWRPRSRHSP